MNEEDFFGELKSHVAKEVLTSLKEHQFSERTTIIIITMLYVLIG